MPQEAQDPLFVVRQWFTVSLDAAVAKPKPGSGEDLSPRRIHPSIRHRIPTVIVYLAAGQDCPGIAG